jgi:hypothetical protein
LDHNGDPQGSWELNPEGFRPGFDHVAGLSDQDGTVGVSGQVEAEAVERAREEYVEGRRAGELGVAIAARYREIEWPSGSVSRKALSSMVGLPLQ